MSYQKLSIHFYSKNGCFIIECSITKSDIIKITIQVPIGNLKTKYNFPFNIMNILSLSIKRLGDCCVFMTEVET